MQNATHDAVADRTRTLFYFVRHGETEYNRKRIVQGRGIDSVLNETGETQAEALARRLASVPFDAIYTSTLQRALQTTQILARSHPEVPVAHLEDLEEMAWGVYEGAPPSADREEELQAIKRRWRHGAFDEPIEGGESVRDVQRRALRAVDHIMEQQRGQTVLVVTHGRFLRVVLASLLDEYGLKRMHELPHSNTAVNRLVGRADTFEADLLNCTAHLDDR
jgi:broad specificity phosphatase PhoE